MLFYSFNNCLFSNKKKFNSISPSVSVQVMAHGGPLESAIEFIIESGAIASVNKNGVVEGVKIGKTIITGQAVGADGFVYSSDTATVRVEVLTGVRIEAPLKRLLSGNKVCH